MLLAVALKDPSLKQRHPPLDRPLLVKSRWVEWDSSKSSAVTVHNPNALFLHNDNDSLLMNRLESMSLVMIACLL